jgi:hypothetical protein
MWEQLLGAGINGLLDLFGQKSQADQQNAAIDEYIKKMKGQLKSDGQINQAVDKVGDVYNTSNANALNDNAFALALKTNGDTSGVQAKMLSGMLAERDKAMLGQRQTIEDQNMKINDAIAQAGLQKESVDFSSLPMNMMVGAMMGKEMFKKPFNPDEALSPNKNKTGTGNTVINAGIGMAGNSFKGNWDDPFGIKAKNQKDLEQMGFRMPTVWDMIANGKY